MLSLIKSKYILAEVFELLPIKCQLKLIVHTKKLQTKLNINLETYKQTFGKYIELNGDYGKEYLVKEQILLFKGHFKNMKRNGQGKELFKNKKIQFEGNIKMVKDGKENI